MASASPGYPPPEVTGPAFGGLGDLRSRVACQSSLGQCDCRLTGEGTVPGWVDDGQRVAQHDGLGAVA